MTKVVCNLIGVIIILFLFIKFFFIFLTSQSIKAYLYIKIIKVAINKG